MERYENQNDIQRNFQTSVLEHALNSISFRCEEQDNHPEQVESYSIAIGKAMNMSYKDLKNLAKAAKLHDLGKTFIDQGILNKPGKLTVAEMEAIKKHPEIGYRLLITDIRYKKLAKCVRHHHERWDGLGYPGGLMGGETPLFSRIIAVADAYDAMTTNRVYQKTKSQKEAVQEIIENSGTQFDPTIVEVFVGKVLLSARTSYTNKK
ncbi:HD-GYP domain-containing protein [Isachenkonia alkalipeptolytica]|nr:HD-GYP domain-containing protein [Isachenkonia alkalipeptolytica]